MSDTCRHCGQPIELIPDICEGRGQWVHTDSWSRCAWTRLTYAEPTAKETK